MKPARAQSTARNWFESLVTSVWYDPQANTFARLLLLVVGTPFSWLTHAKARATREQISQSKTRDAPSPPVLVIGNLVAGGTGKTPLTIAIANSLTQRGLRIALICRGDGASTPVRKPRLVDAQSLARDVGDEALLLAKSTQRPVCVDVQRDDARRHLMSHYRELDLVISDDGLQHQALPRTLELAVFDQRGIGNGRLLPAGPLREPVSHLALMDGLIVNQGTEQASAQNNPLLSDRLCGQGVDHPNKYTSTVTIRDIVALDQFLNLRSPPSDSSGLAVERFLGKPIAAIAAIANPGQFFDSLTHLGLAIRPISVADHGSVTPAMLSEIEESIIITTAKDAVKCPHDPRIFVLRIDANPPSELIDWITEQLNGFPPA